MAATVYTFSPGFEESDGRQLGGVCEQCKLKWHTNMWEISDTGRRILTGNGRRLLKRIQNHKRGRKSSPLSRASLSWSVVINHVVLDATPDQPKKKEDIQIEKCIPIQRKKEKPLFSNAVNRYISLPNHDYQQQKGRKFSAPAKANPAAANPAAPISTVPISTQQERKVYTQYKTPFDQQQSSLRSAASLCWVSYPSGSDTHETDSLTCSFMSLFALQMCLYK